MLTVQKKSSFEIILNRAKFALQRLSKAFQTETKQKLFFLHQLGLLVPEQYILRIKLL